MYPLPAMPRKIYSLRLKNLDRLPGEPVVSSSDLRAFSQLLRDARKSLDYVDDSTPAAARRAYRIARRAKRVARRLLAPVLAQLETAPDTTLTAANCAAASLLSRATELAEIAMEVLEETEPNQVEIALERFQSEATRAADEPSPSPTHPEPNPSLANLANAATHEVSIRPKVAPRDLSLPLLPPAFDKLSRMERQIARAIG